MVGLAGGLGQAVAGGGGLDQLDGRREIDPVADRDEERAAAGLGAQHRTHDLAFVLERRPVASSRSRLGVAAEQARLGNTDGRQVQQHAQMAGEPEPPGMGEALAVHHEEIGGQGEQPQGRDGHRHLAEGKKARAIGEISGQGGKSALLQVQGLRIEPNRRGKGRPTVFAEVHIDASDPPRGEARRCRFHHPVAQGFLNGPRFG